MEATVPMQPAHAHSEGAPSNPIFRIAAIVLAVVALAALMYQSLAGHGDAHGGGDESHDAVPALWAIAPFVGVLLSIALLPLIPATQHWWESNKNRLVVTLSFGAMTLLYYGFTSGGAKVVQILEHAVLAPASGAPAYGWLRPAGPSRTRSRYRENHR